MVNYLTQHFSLAWIKSEAILSVKNIKLDELPKDIYPFRVLPENIKYSNEILGFDIAEVIKEKSVRVMKLNSGDIIYVVSSPNKRDLTLEEYREQFNITKVEVFYEE